MLKNLHDWMVADGITVTIVTGMGTIATQVSNVWAKSDFFGQQQKNIWAKPELFEQL